MATPLKFLIAAPGYNPRSGGVMALHLLCDALNRLGHEASIVLFGGTGPCFYWAYSENPGFYGANLMHYSIKGEDANRAVQNFVADGIVIYPDLIPDNPLNAKRVVRYLLYKHHIYKAQHIGEFILSFSKSFHDSPDAYLFNTLNDPEFHARGAKHWSQRTLDLTYIGKAANSGIGHRLPDTVLVKRDWPEDKNQLGELLRACRFFYSWDAVSQTNVDAVLCGAIPVLIGKSADDSMMLDRNEVGAFPNLQLTDTNNKLSLVGDFAQADACTETMRLTIADLGASWHQRVQAFVDQIIQFYALEKP